MIRVNLKNQNIYHISILIGIFYGRSWEKYNPPEEIQNQMNIATFHHVSVNRHHPEYWDKNLTLDNLNSIDRDKPAKQVDATKNAINLCCSYGS